MRKNEMQAVIDALKADRGKIRAERDSLLTEVHEKTAALETSLASLHRKADAHASATAKHADDLAGLADSIRASLLGKAEPEPQPVTPIASKRGKATG